MIGLTPLLATCSGEFDCWTQVNVVQAIIAALRDVAPLPVFGLITAVSVYFSLYYWSKRHTVPIVTLLLMGGAMFPLLPAAAARLAWILILLSGGLALFGILWTVIR